MSWKKVKIGSFLKERIGRFKPVEANAMGLKRVEKIDFSGTYHLVDKLTNTDMILVKKGDLLISGINAEKGAVTIYNNDDDALATIHYSSYEFDKAKINIQYFKWFLISDAFRNLLKASAGNGIKTELKSKQLLPLEVYLPPLEEQAKIIENINSQQVKLKEVTNEIVQQQTYLQLLGQTILQEVVQGKLTKQVSSPLKGEVSRSDGGVDEPATELLKRIKAEKEKLIKAGKLKKEKELPPITADKIPFELPIGWTWCRLGELSCLITSGSRSWKNFYASEGALFIRSQNIRPGVLNLKDKAYVALPSKTEGSRTAIKLNDILLTITGGNVGNSAVVECEDIGEAYVSQHVALIRLIKNDIIKYLSFVIQAENFEGGQIKKFVYGDKPGLSLTQIQSVIVALPPLAEQQRIVAKVQQLQQQLSQLEDQVQQSRQYAKQLLQSVLKEAFEGNGKMEEMVSMLAGG